ncbi:outer membrane beta-barrel protein [Niabella ginsengisoli]|uniref:PorT family protein n=1 Tax=Niabella ginsengisoli TaxID=522298 RepID=A0ABS9SFV9_9BACT|nr:outer membrane beta-barrel protein [Niabella ginsengisoli]MCH5597242.1 PorT family protein [Niabella ginsengisoli]
MTNGREGSVDASKSLNSFNAGVIGAIPLGSTFEIRTGLDFQSKGTESENSDGTITNKVNPMYLELPVNVAVMLPLNEKMKAYIGAGPYAALGLGGKLKTTTTVDGQTNTTSRNINWGNDNPADPNENSTGLQGTVGSGDFKRFDFGANIIAGLDFGKFGVHAQYGIGLTNTNPGRSNEDNANKNNQHRAIGVSGVFYF